MNETDNKCSGNSEYPLTVVAAGKYNRGPHCLQKQVWFFYAFSQDQVAGKKPFSTVLKYKNELL